MLKYIVCFSSPFWCLTVGFEVGVSKPEQVPATWKHFLKCLANINTMRTIGSIFKNNIEAALHVYTCLVNTIISRPKMFSSGIQRDTICVLEQ